MRQIFFRIEKCRHFLCLSFKPHINLLHAACPVMLKIWIKIRVHKSSRSYGIKWVKCTESTDPRPFQDSLWNFQESSVVYRNCANKEHQTRDARCDMTCGGNFLRAGTCCRRLSLDESINWLHTPMKVNWSCDIVATSWINKRLDWSP